MKTTLLLFVDGLGLGPDEPAVNPIHAGGAPCLSNLLANHARPVDARLGVAGLPQSATGQTALLTGINAPQRMGRHVEGFPGHHLRALIRHHNVFRALSSRGHTVTFANGYYVDDEQPVQTSRLRSVTTVAALDGCPRLRVKADLLANAAVCQDLTRAALRPRGYQGPLILPSVAAEHLVSIATAHAFTLFEYFQTDRAGHKGDPATVQAILSQYDVFLERLLTLIDGSDITLLLTSDHGNIEDLRVKTHTLNPVPLVALGPGAAFFRERVRALTDITPAIVQWHGDQAATPD